MRRRGFCTLSTLGLLGGCLQLQEQSTGETDDGTETSPDGEDGDTRTETDGIERDTERIDLVEAWSRDVDSIAFHDGSFVGVVRPPHSDEVETTRLERYDEHGEIDWSSDEIEDGYRFAITEHDGGGIRSLDGAIVTAATGMEDTDGARLYAFDSETGEQLWVHETDGERAETYFRALTVHDETIYYGVTDSGGTDEDQNPSIRAIDTTTGDVRWEEQFDEGFFSGITVFDDRLYVGRGWELNVFERETGTRVHEEDVSIGFDGFIVTEDTLYFAESELQAYDPVDDELRWEREPDRTFDSGITHTNGTIYGGTRSGWVLARDESDGDLLWETRIDGSVINPLLVDHGVLWTVSDSHELSALNADTGAILYERENGSRRIATGSGRVFIEETAYELERSEA
ncbi:hypothetical protein EA462_15620 [Natrarchaeobius halalkaliphilus]|uniref:Pyrrolo-quinoline quinone repeat domain-containing protein n=1 Tax=Natrarchaeobius halalkaliphilus TaxID=1679091 RepID=A0A3N6NUZ4_9EURY|nr:PQQ-binding-like beta-propeller repeat protein [Natrarchaeobius halalkaliphilus]RQG87060.1 hypothetical protein EA462_15620 [Natrarchaeobius halalkaliphilus]